MNAIEALFFIGYCIVALLIGANAGEMLEQKYGAIGFLGGFVGAIVLCVGAFFLFRYIAGWKKR